MLACSKICICAQKLIICHRFLRLEDFANVFLKSGRALTINTQVTWQNTSPFGKVALNRARSHSSNVTVIARIQSDLIDLLIIALTFVCVIEARGQTQFLLLKHSGCRPN